MSRAIFYDTETTGIDANRDRVIELAAYDPEREERFSTLINPGRSIPKEATAIHHITDEMVADAPPFSEVIDAFVQFCEGAILVAHNNDAFDIHFLRQEFTRAERPLPDWHFVDSLKWARRYRPDLPRHSLQFLREIYGFASNNAHRALDDVIILHQVFTAMTDDLPITVVHQLLNRSQLIEKMPFGKHRNTALKELPLRYVRWLEESGTLEKPENSDLKRSLAHYGML